MINNYKEKNINYEILMNLNEIKNEHKNIMNDLNNINNDESINNKFS